MLWLPTADKEERGRSLSFTETTDPKGCLHTTESSNWPTYRDWTVHPHATIKPVKNHGISLRQHVSFNRASFALRNQAGGVETNRDYVFQFELIGTSEKGGPGYYWPDADEAVLEALFYRVIKPLKDELNVPIQALPFQSYPESYGPNGKTNTVRLTGRQFDAYSGWLGHQHVPENSHGDPGAFPWDRMMRLVQPQKPSAPKAEDDNGMIAYYTEKDPKAAFTITGEKLRRVTGVEVGAIRDAGGIVRFVELPSTDPLWKMEKM